MKTIVERIDVAEQDTWDLSPMYADAAAWRSDYSALENSLGEAQQFAGHLGDGEHVMRKSLETQFRQFRLIEKLYTYAHLRSDQDTRDAGNLALVDLSRNLYTRLIAEWSYLTPEVLALPEDVAKRYQTSEELRPYRRVLDEMLRYKPHTLSASEEALLARSSEALSASNRIFSQLNNADMNFGTVTVDGEEQELSHGSYQVLLKHRDRAVRKAAFEGYYRVYDELKNTISTTLTTSIQKDLFYSRARRFPGTRESMLFAENMPLEVYDNLIETVSKNLEPLYRYYELRKKALKLDVLKPYDLSVPLVSEVEKKVPFDDGARHILAALKPLGEDYVGVLQAGLTTARWTDRYENKGKKSGAYSSGCYDSPPYLLMNYQEDSLHDFFTLAHEAGHSMHSHYAIKHQSYQDHSYGIFVAEVASTFNEQLLSSYLENLWKDEPSLLAYLINEQIEDIRGTLIRQAMFAEFEREIHERVGKNEPLTLVEYRSIYGGLLRKYFGPALDFGDVMELEFLRVPHFYSSFYVYKYSTGISAAIFLAERVLNGGVAEREAYLSFLKAGGSKYPLEVLRDAGVDMASPKPIQAALKKFDGLVERLEKLLG